MIRTVPISTPNSRTISTSFITTRFNLCEFGDSDSLSWPSKNEYHAKMGKRKYVRLKAA